MQWCPAVNMNTVICSCIIFSLCLLELNCLIINGKDYKVSHVTKDDVSTRVIYPNLPFSTPWVARSIYNKTYLKTGWDTFDVESNPEVEDSEQAFLAGYLEGVETHTAIYDHYYNTLHGTCDKETILCAQINEYLDTNVQWIKSMVEQHAASDIYWRQVNLFYQQLAGITVGHNNAAPTGESLTFRDILWINFAWDFDDLKSALKNETNKALSGNSHCSALIKILHGQSDILVSHNTWTGFNTMKRIMKRYILPYNQVVGTAISFSSYPAAITSGDDFYIVNSGLVVQETSIENNNASLWVNLKPTNQVLEAVRAVVANRMASSGRSWTKIFSDFNSGTYNNQWMVVDMNKFSPGSVKPELLWVLEQMPGHIRREDQTEVLIRQGYWASYNVPFYPDVFNLSGTQELVKQYGDFFTYNKTPRALIFKRDQDKVIDIHSMMLLMRSNDFKHDPLSKCACDPPYSAENAIASRNDLNQINGSYPFYALSHRCSGATDAKVTSYQLSRSLALLAVSGPTTGAHLPPFQWSKSDFNHQVSHRGHPDLFKFQPVLISWPTQHKDY